MLRSDPIRYGYKTSEKCYSEQLRVVDVSDLGAFMSESDRKNAPDNSGAQTDDLDFDLKEEGSLLSRTDKQTPDGVEGFPQQLGQARELLQNSDLEGAFRVLRDLEAQYIAASSLFDLLGDVLIRKGDVDQGFHYKQLHQILNRTLQIARGAKQETRVYPATPTSEEEVKADLVYTPVTAAMARELMRQGHFDKAAKILDILTEQNPDDLSLREARNRVVRENRVVRTLGGWLSNIKQIKASRSIAE
jgi:hypothetical protein